MIDQNKISSSVPLPEKSAADILAADDRPFFPVEVPQWGCKVFVRELDVRQQCLIHGSCRDSQGELDRASYVAKLLIESTYESDGKGGYKLKFGPEHYEALKGRNQKAIALIAGAIELGIRKNGNSAS